MTRVVVRVVGTVDKNNPYVEVGALAMVEVPPNWVITDFDAQRAAETRAVVMELAKRYNDANTASQYDDLLSRIHDMWMPETRRTT